MKMFYKIFISCIFLWIGNICHAQKGLAIAPLFSGKYDKDEQAIVVLLKGKTLHPYGLSLFHSRILPVTTCRPRWRKPIYSVP